MKVMPSWMVASSAAGLLGHARDAPGSLVTLIAELPDAAPADRHERDLGGHEDAVERDEDGDDDDLQERAAHQRPAASSEPAGRGAAPPRPAGGAHGCGPASRGPACRRARPCVTTAAAPVTASSPTLTGARRMVSEPMNGAVADAGAVLADAVEVGGDGAGPDVHPLAHLGVAEVAEVVALRAPPEGAVLHLGVVAELDPAADAGALADVGEGADGHVGLHDGRLEDARPDDRALPDARVEDLAAGPDVGVTPDGGLAAQHDAGLDGHVLGDPDAGVDERAGRIDDGDPGAHVPPR